jgi:hypothetical protein
MTVTTVSRGVGGGDAVATEKKNSAGTNVPQHADGGQTLSAPPDAMIVVLYGRRSTGDLCLRAPIKFSTYSNDLYQI